MTLLIFAFIFRMRILLIDNNDSFTYNLFHLIKGVISIEDSIEVCLTDGLTVDMAGDFDRIIISPGPGIPSESRILMDIIEAHKERIPLLGICLGHQAIAESYGALIRNMSRPIHGTPAEITIANRTRLFRGVNRRTVVGRYHSWEVSSADFPACLEITAIDDNGCIMAFSHREHDVYGVQFHPESFMTDCGQRIIANFIKND